MCLIYVCILYTYASGKNNSNFVFLQRNVTQTLIANGSYRALENYESEEFMS